MKGTVPRTWLLTTTAEQALDPDRDLGTRAHAINGIGFVHGLTYCVSSSDHMLSRVLGEE